ncbi:peptide chain release factor N(5)-glutamine methyltransferase [Simiduia sp. 21SJ11W-1]|uniref:peptide chain release factor N(5)-glutamine methyltransferase n=1 Tax=Simiduia sp. 21SJ11W-1 TaxID=2909669 RepID=UPI0020A0DA8C|nr:peptide chain release factor N(5)-glutamine methyltransferase [Simiduia sp. 21SJ11W-1]UTA47476.1 peptide chain release factor N(5)-glutamine methyltransferase [Simiduia sp. 21SJ11W-1]
MATVADLLQQARSLTDVSDTARLDTELLLCRALNKTRSFLYTWPEKQVDPAAALEFNALLKRRQKGEPIAYILGQQEFWSLPLAVAPSTLIPRADTETLVAWALQRKLPAGAHVVDLGTGTGAIALALAHERPQWQLTGVDLSHEAVALAQTNAANLNINNCTFLQGSWYEPLDRGQFHLIVTNPPYIDATDPHLAQGDVRFEPHSALVAADQGLADLKTIAEGACNALHPGGWLGMEHGFAQAPAVQSLLQSLCFKQVASESDLGGQPRITFGQWPE